MELRTDDGTSRFGPVSRIVQPFDSTLMRSRSPCGSNGWVVIQLGFDQGDDGKVWDLLLMVW